MACTQFRCHVLLSLTFTKRTPEPNIVGLHTFIHTLEHMHIASLVWRCVFCVTRRFDDNSNNSFIVIVFVRCQCWMFVRFLILFYCYFFCFHYGFGAPRSIRRVAFNACVKYVRLLDVFQFASKHQTE